MKKITIIGTPNAEKNFQVVNVTISEQTNVGNTFGNIENGSAFKASNGVVLFSSVGGPEASNVKDRIYVRGTDASKNLRTVEVSPEFYSRLLAAADEYNKTFKEKVVRHITADFGPNPADNFQTVLVTITKQSDRGNDFTDEGNTFKATNGIVIMSSNYPSFGFYANTLTVRGATAHRDNDAVKVPVAEVPRIKAALKEYNLKYAAPAQPVKTLKIEGDPCPASDYQRVKVTITQQKGILDQFGNPAGKSKGAVGEFIHGKIRLASCAQDAVGYKAGVPTGACAKNGLIGTFYVGNKPTVLGDKSLTCEVPVEVYPLIQQAVLAYNKAFAPKRYVERLTCTSTCGTKVGAIMELVEARPSGSWLVKTSTGGTEFWDSGNGKEVSALAADSEVTKNGITTVG